MVRYKGFYLVMAVMKIKFFFAVKLFDLFYVHVNK
jgi:hypothetical protein